MRELNDCRGPSNRSLIRPASRRARREVIASRRTKSTYAAPIIPTPLSVCVLLVMSAITAGCRRFTGNSLRFLASFTFLVMLRYRLFEFAIGGRLGNKRYHTVSA